MQIYMHRDNYYETVMIFPHVIIIGVYRSPAVPVQQWCYALNEVLSLSW